MRSLKIDLYIGFKKVDSATMVTALSEEEALDYCRDKFIGKNPKIAKKPNQASPS